MPPYHQTSLALRPDEHERVQRLTKLATRKISIIDIFRRGLEVIEKENNMAGSPDGTTGTTEKG